MHAAARAASRGDVEYGPTPAMFSPPSDPRTADYAEGRFG